MKPLTLIPGILICAVLFSSCQKEANGLPSNESSQVKTYTEDVTSGPTHYSETYNLSYDGDGKLKTMQSVNSAGSKFVYTYNSNSSFQMEIYNSNLLSIHVEFYLNSSSFIDSTFQYNDTNDSTTEKYIYNSKNELTQQKSYSYTKATGGVLDNITTYEYDSEGNVVKEDDGSSVTTYDYYPDLTNTLLLNFTPYTNQSPKLVKTTTYISSGETTVLHHTYTFDDKKRLTSETITQDGADLTVVKSYTY